MRGGYRPRSGRKPDHGETKIPGPVYKLTPTQVQQLRKRAAERGLNLTQAVESSLRAAGLID